MDIMAHADIKDGMFPTKWDMNTAEPTNGKSDGGLCCVLYADVTQISSQSVLLQTALTNICSNSGCSPAKPKVNRAASVSLDKHDCSLTSIHLGRRHESSVSDHQPLAVSYS